MIRLSSNSTLFAKFFVPVFFTVFYGAFSALVLFNKLEISEELNWFKWTNMIFCLATIFIFWKTIFQLMRVELDAETLFISNYKSSFRYTMDSVESIDVHSYFLFKVAVVNLKNEGSLGKRISFIINNTAWERVEKEQTSFSALINAD